MITVIEWDEKNHAYTALLWSWDGCVGGCLETIFRKTWGLHKQNINWSKMYGYQRYIETLRNWLILCAISK